ncbi:MAG: cytochrome c maturation protein CcmE [Gammaproteobacteria bacterium]|nr:cytochrome c maturation protein CcmE [Gammaproteobacteria bacterium]
MNRKQKRKLIAVMCLLVALSIAAGLILYALKQNINLFYTPTELLQATTTPKQTIRLGGYVKKGSIHYDASGTHVHFTVTDRTHDIDVSFDGVLPNLFREGQAVVTTGNLTAEKQFEAHEVLAKHDEKYMPRSLAKDLQKPIVR